MIKAMNRDTKRKRRKRKDKNQATWVERCGSKEIQM